MIVVFWLLYMCVVVLILIMEVKVWRGRVLVKRNMVLESVFWYVS